VLNVQYEYDLFGEMGGEYVVALLTAVRKPVITTMHTSVLTQRISQICMSELLQNYSTAKRVLSKFDASYLCYIDAHHRTDEPRSTNSH
jgi:hypothetical protein